MQNTSNTFENFLLSEYQNIAQAHFKSIETISTFFRYYLLIMSIPISAIAIVFQISPNKVQIMNIISQYKFVVSPILFLISFVGFMVFCYIVNLRLDVILYARAVNGIRKSFYDESEIDINLKQRMRALPQSPQLPAYYEKSYFLPVVSALSVINSFYFSIGYCILAFPFLLAEKRFVFSEDALLELIGAIIIVILLHFVIYFIYAHHRETAYLKSNIIGIDIDGVINKHREHFCPLIFEKTGKSIKPEQITIMPVHEHPTLGINRDDERQVFNDPKYWIDMPIIENAVQNIRRMKNTFKLKIFIFTSRPWPDDPNRAKLYAYIKSFMERCNDFSIKIAALDIILDTPILKRLSILIKEQPLCQITKEWLKRHNFKYDNFFFEKGNDYSSDPRGKFRNRFYIARKKKIRFFVEDDFEKAIKLSYVCDVVFLYSHPYNKPQPDLPVEKNRIRKEIPSNIIRIDTWDEIYQHIRRLS